MANENVGEFHTYDHQLRYMLLKLIFEGVEFKILGVVFECINDFSHSFA